jgi:organic radical activating enzyme
MNTFNPDLIVEVTGACNKACVGCYAPNVVTNEGAETFFEKRPELFLSVTGMNKAMNDLQLTSSITSIRGGEPTLHPKLPILLTIASNKSNQVYLETHGRWLLPQNINSNKVLIQTIKEKKIIVKISFDKMHGMNGDELKAITEFLTWNDINFKVAITEESLANYLVTRSHCYWVSEDKIIFQQKVSHEADLIKPNIGTINVRGEIKKSLTHKFEEEISLGLALG